MKTKILTTALLFLSIITSAQISKNDKTVYLDSKWQETTFDNHSYIRIIKNYLLTQDLYEIKEYYKSGAIRTKGFSKDKNQFAKEGELTIYYENGNKRKVSHFSNKRLVGKEEEWYENGNKKSEKEYTPEEKESQNKIKILQYWNSNNTQVVIDGNGDYEENTKEHQGKGKLKNGYKDGIWEGKDLKENFSYTEIYQNGKFISGISTDQDNNKYPYKELGNNPTPAKGIEEFYRFVGKNYKRPSIKDLEGKIQTTFWIDKDGNITDIKILKDIGYGTGEEAIRLLQKAEKWIPGKSRGMAMKMQYSLPISIKTSAGKSNYSGPAPSYQSERLRHLNSIR